MSDWINVVKTEELVPGQACLVDVDDTLIAIFNIDGDYFAIENVCSHDGSELLIEGLESTMRVNGDEITCPHHGARFCIKTGEALCPPAYEPINKFPTRVVNGMVQIIDNRRD